MPNLRGRGIGIAGLFFVGIGVILLVGLAASPAALPVPQRTVVVPSPDLILQIDVAQEGLVLSYTVQFDNVGEGVAKSVELTIHLPAGSTYLGDPSDLQNGTWVRTFQDLAPGAYNEMFSVELPETTTDLERVTSIAELRYIGYSGPWTMKAYEHDFAVSLPRPVPPMPLWIAAAPAGAALAGIGGFAVIRGRRRPKLEQVFLMHNSGMLIHHWAETVSPTRDIDILSGMFVILKEFVRDSFREKDGGLTELQFGDSRMFLYEGSHAILAAVVSGKHVNGFPMQIQAAVNDFEARQGPALANWSGSLERLSGAKEVVDALVSGQYVRGRAA